MMAKLSLLERVLVFYGSAMPNHPRKWWLHARLRNLLAVHPAGYHCVRRGKLHWKLDPSDYAHSELFWLGIKDGGLLEYLITQLNDNAVIVDAGAGFGYLSLCLAQSPRVNATVLAIEPYPKNFRCLRYNTKANSLSHKVHLRCLGLAEKSGQAWIIDRCDNSGASRVTTDATVSPVNLVSLDDLCEQESLARLDLVLLDVEGYEIRALAGARKTLTRFMPLLLVKVWSTSLALAGGSIPALQEALLATGYIHFFRITRHELKQLTQLPDEPQSVWVVCCR